jgi:hypothetical protein
VSGPCAATAATVDPRHVIAQTRGQQVTDHRSPAFSASPARRPSHLSHLSLLQQALSTCIWDLAPRKQAQAQAPARAIRARSSPPPSLPSTSCGRCPRAGYPPHIASHCIASPRPPPLPSLLIAKIGGYRSHELPNTRARIPRPDFLSVWVTATCACRVPVSCTCGSAP